MATSDNLAEFGLSNDTQALHERLQHIRTPDLNAAVSTVVSILRGRPYQFDPCGEGIEGDIDKRAMGTTATFDCFTFVNTVLAMIAQNQNDPLSTALTHLQQLRYLEPTAKYFYRHHFAETTWTEQNRKKNYLTGSLLSSTQWSSFRKTATLSLDYPAWLRHQKEFFLPNHTPPNTAEHLQYVCDIEQLEVPSLYQEKRTINFDYIPLDALIKASQDDPLVSTGPAWDLLPNCCLLQLICDNWTDTQKHKLGRLQKSPTPLAIVHLGFLHTQNNVRCFSHAKINQHTETIPLIEYLHFLQQEAPHVSGIHLEGIGYPTQPPVS